MAMKRRRRIMGRTRGEDWEEEGEEAENEQRNTD